MAELLLVERRAAATALRRAGGPCRGIVEGRMALCELVTDLSLQGVCGGPSRLRLLPRCPPRCSRALCVIERGSRFGFLCFGYSLRRRLYL